MEGLVVLILIALVICIIVLPIVALCRIGDIQQSLDALRRELAGRAPLPRASAAPLPKPAVPAAPPPKPVVHEAPPPKPVVPEAPLPKPVMPAVPPSKPTALEILVGRIGDWIAVRGEFAPKGMTREFAFVTRWLIRLGAALLVGCIVYFMKLSVDRGWVGPVARTISVIVWGALFAVFGAVLVRRGRYAPVGHALAGLGFVGMYLGFGLGHRFFDPPVIASPVFAFAALAVVTVLAGVYAVRLPSAAVAVLGLVGGYLVPVIAGRDSGNPLGLYAYLLALNLAAAHVACRRRWSALNFLAAGLAFVMCAVWQGRHPGAARSVYFLSFAFLSAVHVLYLGATVAGAKSRGSAGNALAWTGLSLNAAGYLAWLLVVLRPIARDEVTGLILLATVALYAALARLAIVRGWADRITVQTMLLFAFAYLAFAPLMIVSRPYLATAWCLIAAASGEAGRRSREPILGVLGLLLVILACVLSLVRMLPFDGGGAAFAGSYFTQLVSRIVRFASPPVTLAAFAARGWCAADGTELRRFLWGLAAALAFVYLTLEARLFGLTFLPGLKGGTVTLAWGLLAVGALVGGVLRRLKVVRILALVLLGLAVAKLLVLDTAHLDTPARVLAFGLTGLALIAGAIVYLKFRERFTDHEA